MDVNVLELRPSKGQADTQRHPSQIEPSGPDRPLVRMRREIDEYVKVMLGFAQLDPQEVLIQVSAIAARLNAMRIELHRLGNSPATHLRTKEVDPLIGAMDTQFKIHSRLLTAREFEFRLAGGQPS